MAAPATYSRQQLRTVLTNWHTGNPAVHPALFPGPLAAKGDLADWLEDVRQRCVNHLNLHRWHWPNAVISWISAATNGGTGFREQLLDVFSKKRNKQELVNNRFWEWNDFRQTFEHLCVIAKVKRYGTIGAVAIGGGVLVPALGVATLAAAGFTAGGVAAGSIAATIQSTVFGGATGGVFSILQSIGAQGAFPVLTNFVVGAAGAVGAAAVTTPSVDPGNSELGDIGEERGSDSETKSKTSATVYDPRFASNLKSRM